MRRPLAIAAVAAALLLPLTACAAAAPATTTIDASGAPNADTVAISGGLDAGIDRALAALPSIVEDVLAESHVPGMAVAVVAGGETVFAEGYGTKVAGTDDPVDADTVFQIASVSKSLTGTIIAKAVGDDLVDWDTPVRELLPGFALGDPYVTGHGTIADYMSHRSGLYTGAGDDLEMLGFDRATILDRLRLLPLDAFRSTYNYSNFGITVAGEATAAAAGTSWEDLADETLFGPLGMTSTSFRYQDFLDRPDRATINALVDGEFAPLYERDPDAEAPAGGASSSVVDLAKWMNLVLADGAWEGEPLIEPDALLPAISAQIISSHAGAPDQRAGAYGYGFNVGTAVGGQPIVSHSGAFLLGTGTNYRLLPGLGVGIVVLTNGSPVGAAESVAATFTDVLLLGAPSRDWYPAFAASFEHFYAPEGDLAEAEPPTSPAPPGDLAGYAGVYTNAYYGDLTVTVEDGALVGRLGPVGFRLDLEPWDGDVFAVPIGGEEAPAGSRSSATFTMSDGTASAVTLAYFDKRGLGTFVRVG